MPIVGPRAIVNDHFVEQVVMDAKAAIDKAVELGVTDPNRVGVGGPSYGAFMTDTLRSPPSVSRTSGAPCGRIPNSMRTFHPLCTPTRSRLRSF
jgi:hypothetical protein